jgi:uncharacterized protein (DUF1778 family)
MARRAKEDKPRYHVLSVRVSNEDREALEKVAKASNKNVSDLLREVFSTMVPR